MINKQHPKLAIKSQCQLLSISRSSVYRQAKGESDYNLELMRLMGLMPIYQKPNTSKPNKQHKIYPYLLRGLNITEPNHV